MSLEIHPTAIVHEGAELGDNVVIGAYSIIGKDVKIASNCTIHSHVHINGHTRIDEGNEFFPYSSIGAQPQDLSYKGEPTETIIGKNNIFREYVSVHRGTLKQDKKTIIGDNNLLMSYVHFGHDVKVGSNCVIVNSVNLAGHVTLGDKVIVGGGTQLSQFVTVGRGGYIGGATAVDRDVPPFCTAYGNRVRLKGINIVGLRRAGYEKAEITELVDFYRTMEASALSPRAFVDHQELMEEFQNNSLVDEISGFIRESEIGVAPFIS